MAEQIIEGRVIQKIATVAEWSASTLPLKKGEFAIVSDSTGKPINIRVGNGTLPFSGLVDMFDNIQQNVNFIKYNGGSALPSPTIGTGYTFVSEGSYTFAGSPAFTVPAGHWGTANWDGNSWSFTDLGEIKGEKGEDGASLLAPWVSGQSYPLNAVVLLNDGQTQVRNTLENNTNNPNTGGAGWVSAGVSPSELAEKADIINSEGRVYRSELISDQDVYTNVPPANDYGNASGYWHNGTGGSGTPASVQAATNRKRMDFNIADLSKNYVASGSVIGGLRVSLVVYVDASGNYLGQQLPVGENTTESFDRVPLTLPAGTAKILASSINNAVVIIETVAEETTYDDPLPGSETYNKTQTNNLLAQKASEVDQDGKIIRGAAIQEDIYQEVEGQSPTGGAVVTGNGYIQRSTGAIAASSTRKVIFFPIDPENLEYDITTNMSATSQMALAVYYDSNRNQLKNGQGQSQEGISFEVPFSASGDFQFTNYPLNPPANAAFIGTTNQNTRPITLRSKQSVTTFKEAVFENDPSINPLFQKNILALGDSIIKANEIGNVGFIEKIAEFYGMNVINRAVGGATMAVVSGSTNNIPAQIDNAIAAGLPVPDFVIFDGLTNDITGSSTVQLGSIAANYLESSFDKSTFSGGMEYVLRKIRTTWLATKIVYVRVHKMSSRDTTKQQSFGDRAQEICNKWSVPVVDIFNSGELNSYLPEMYEVYTNNSDRTHPNLEGYLLFYVPPTVAKMKSLV